MTDLEKLTALCGSPRKTADLLKVDIRTFWNYKKGAIPKSMQLLIELKLREMQQAETQKAS